MVISHIRTNVSQEPYPDEDEDDEEKLEGLLRELAEHQRLKDSLTNQRDQLSQLRDNLARGNQEPVRFDIIFDRRRCFTPQFYSEDYFESDDNDTITASDDGKVDYKN